MQGPELGGATKHHPTFWRTVATTSGTPVLTW